jgi:nitroreductase
MFQHSGTEATMAQGKMKDTEYERFLDLLKKRHSTRNFKSDPIPKGYAEKVIEAARWAMSGANAQPWEFIIIRDPETIKALFDAYRETIVPYNFWTEQMHRPEFRHPAFQLEGDPEEQLEKMLARPGWSVAPVVIAVMGDGRRQMASVSGSHVPGRGMSHLTDGIANACQIIHLAAASLGLASQWVTLHIQEPLKRILKVPDVITLHSMVPLGYPVKKPRGSFRRKLEEILHQETYDPYKYMSDREIVDYIGHLRRLTFGTYARSRGR